MIRRFLEWYRARQRIARTRTLLHTLSDQTLRDIGLRREQIDDVQSFLSR